MTHVQPPLFSSPGAVLPATRPTETQRLARVTLSRAAEPGDLTTASLVEQLGPEGAVEHQLDPKKGSQLHSRLLAVDPARELERAERQGIRFVIPGDPEWPTWIDDLSETGSVVVQEMGGLPVGLWVRGPMPLSAVRDSVAIVGSRSSTTYGTDVARDIAAVVARAGLPVISGAAVGIDLAAHRGALGGGGATLAVLACGVDRPYPSANTELIRYLWEHYAVVSEVAPGSAPTRRRFLARNRIIAALARGTVVTEAALRSGALNTANWTECLSRPVMGVPGPVTSAASQGIHSWIRRGAATLVTHGSEVLELLGASGEHLVEVPRAPERPRDRLDPVDQMVLEAVPLVQAAPVDSIAHTAAEHIRSTDSALRRLEQAGFVERVPGGWRQCRAG